MYYENIFYTNLSDWIKLAGFPFYLSSLKFNFLQIGTIIPIKYQRVIHIYGRSNTAGIQTGRVYFTLEMNLISTYFYLQCPLFACVQTIYLN